MSLTAFMESSWRVSDPKVAMAAMRVGNWDMNMFLAHPDTPEMAELIELLRENVADQVAAVQELSNSYWSNYTVDVMALDSLYEPPPRYRNDDDDDDDGPDEPRGNRFFPAVELASMGKEYLVLDNYLYWGSCAGHLYDYSVRIYPGGHRRDISPRHVTTLARVEMDTAKWRTVLGTDWWEAWKEPMLGLCHQCVTSATTCRSCQRYNVKWFYDVRMTGLCSKCGANKLFTKKPPPSDFRTLRGRKWRMTA